MTSPQQINRMTELEFLRRRVDESTFSITHFAILRTFSGLLCLRYVTQFAA